MKWTFLFAAFLLALASTSSSAVEGEVLVDRIVAVVDGHPILYSSVMDKVDKGPLVVVSEYPAEETSPPYERALQDAINFQLVMAKAKDLEIDVRDDEVEAEIARRNAPGYDPNPNTGAPFRANSETRVAHNTIYFDAKHPSHILLPVAVKRSASG